MDKIALTFAKMSNRSQQHKEMCFVAAMKLCMDTVVSRQLQLFRILVTGSGSIHAKSLFWAAVHLDDADASLKPRQTKTKPAWIELFEGANINPECSTTAAT